MLKLDNLGEEFLMSRNLSDLLCKLQSHDMVLLLSLKMVKGGGYG